MTSLIDPTALSPQLTILTRCQGETATAALRGEVDIASAGDLDRELRRLEATGVECIRVNFEHLAFIDSTGLHTLLAAHLRAQENNRRLVLTHISPFTRRLLNLTGLNTQLAIE